MPTTNEFELVPKTLLIKINEIAAREICHIVQPIGKRPTSLHIAYMSNQKKRV